MSKLPKTWETFTEISEKEIPVVPEPAFPLKSQRFAALAAVNPMEIRVTVIGQDPYHGPDQAHGFAFSVPDGVTIPPSLRNIFKELVADIGCAMPTSGNLNPWARQGVLLLNTALSVSPGLPGSHSHIGWENVTDRIIEAISERCLPSVFILWGAHAIARRPLVDESRHLVIASPHPSPLAARRGFFGSRPFSRANAWLEEQGRGGIDWGTGLGTQSDKPAITQGSLF